VKKKSLLKLPIVCSALLGLTAGCSNEEEKQSFSDEEEIVYTQEDIDSYKASLVTKQQELDRVNSLLSSANADLEIKKSELAVLSQELEEKETELASLQEDVNSNKIAIETLQSDIVTLQTSISTKESEINNLETEISEMKAQIANVETNISTIENKITTLENELDYIPVMPTGDGNYYLAISDGNVTWNEAVADDSSSGGTSTYIIESIPSDSISGNSKQFSVSELLNHQFYFAFVQFDMGLTIDGTTYYFYGNVPLMYGIISDHTSMNNTFIGLDTTGNAELRFNMRISDFGNIDITNAVVIKDGQEYTPSGSCNILRILLIK